ncbi:MAG: type II toxin-antitoxin system PemK/MazF family toxin [Candidatus Krumholzibacteriia bacterium]
MPRNKIAITLDAGTLAQLDLLAASGVYPNRSQAIQSAVDDTLARPGPQPPGPRVRQPRSRPGGGPCRGPARRRQTVAMARILRGDIRLADLDRSRRRKRPCLRPVLVLSHDVFNERSGTVLAVAVVNEPPRAGFPLSLALTADTIAEPCWARISQVRTLAVDRLGRRLGPAARGTGGRGRGLREIMGD